jgi:toxin ParE1/3/4
MKIIISPLAEIDIEQIGDYIAQDNPRRALSYIKELRKQCTKIATFPQAYRLRSELGAGIRSCAYGNYVIFFQINDNELHIVRILHGAMDIESKFNS